jgi:hypothetical protein
MDDDKLRTRLEVIEARLADLERGPAPRLGGVSGTYTRLMQDPLYQDAIGGGEQTPDADARVSAALWATQVIARDLDALRDAVQEALNSPGSRPNLN